MSSARWRSSSAASFRSAPKPDLRPLGPADLRWAAEHLLDAEHRLIPAVAETLKTKLAAIGAQERCEALAAVLLPRLVMELAGLELREDGEPDLTKVGGLLTIQQVGMWIKTTIGP